MIENTSNVTYPAGRESFYGGSVNSLNNARKNSRYSQGDLKRLQKSSQEFEALFWEIMLKSMRESVQKSGWIDGGNGEKVFQGMLDSEYAKSISQQRLTGISQAIEKQLLNLNHNAAKISDHIVGIKAYRNTLNSQIKD